MRIILVRHGQPEWVADERAVQNPRLTITGRHQAERTAERLVAESFDHALVSPLLRAAETAAPTRRRIARTPETHEFLAEIRPPNWDGRPMNEVRQTIDDHKAGPLTRLWDGLPGGESIAGFHDRVTGGWNNWLAGHDARPLDGGLWELSDAEQTVVVFAHAGTNAATIGHFLGVPPSPWEWQRFATRHASVSILEPFEVAGAWAYSLLRMNCVEHLPDGLTTA